MIMQNTIIKDYTIKNELGQGGMATVYLAEHNLLGNKSAFKLLNKEFVNNDNIRKRFLSEARNMARMSHPGIIKVTDLIDEGDIVAFVMEYIEGETLKEYLDRKGKIQEVEIKSIFSQMLDAVGYVHEQNLVHRDIKPSNFMIAPNGSVKLLDFGIAKNTDPNSVEYTQTLPGAQMGTPMYMSPEQITETKNVTPQSDIYSLGVVLWQLVTAEKPYDMKTLTNFQLQMKIVQEELPQTNTNWDTYIQKATSKNNENRYSSCKEFSLKLNTENNTLQVNDSDKTIVNTSVNTEKTIIEQKVQPEVLLEGSILDSDGNLKYGLINLKGEWVIQPMFDEALYINDQGFSIAKINDKYGLIDRKGNWTIQPIFEYLAFDVEQGFLTAKLNDKYGVINQVGNWIIQPKFEKIYYFDAKGFSRVKLNDRWGCINQKGDWLIQPMFNYLWDFDKEDFAQAEINEKWGFIDRKGKCGFIDRKGNWIIQPIFDNVDRFDDYNYSKVQLNDKHGFIDRKGNWIIQPIFDDAYSFDEFGYSTALLNDKLGFIDRQGNWIIQPIFDEVDRFDESGFARVKINEKWGFIDKKGNWIIQPMFEVAMNFYDQVYAPVQSNEKWGFIDRKGNWSINPRFDYAHNFDHGFSIVEEADKRGIIDINGNWVIQPDYMVEKTKNNLWKVSDGKQKYGYKNFKNEWVIQPTFDYIFDEDDFDWYDDEDSDDEDDSSIETDFQLPTSKDCPKFFEGLTNNHKIYFGDNIPAKKLNNFTSQFNTEFFIGAEKLVYYDNTLFGKGDNGFYLVNNYDNTYLCLSLKFEKPFCVSLFDNNHISFISSYKYDSKIGVVFNFKNSDKETVVFSAYLNDDVSKALVAFLDFVYS
jgi:serine/threonine protein kinase